MQVLPMFWFVKMLCCSKRCSLYVFSQCLNHFGWWWGRLYSYTIRNFVFISWFSDSNLPFLFVTVFMKPVRSGTACAELAAPTYMIWTRICQVKRLYHFHNENTQKYDYFQLNITAAIGCHRWSLSSVKLSTRLDVSF